VKFSLQNKDNMGENMRYMN